MIITLTLVALAALATATFLFLRLRRTRAERDAFESDLGRFRGVIDAEAERNRVLAQLQLERDATRAAADRERESVAQQLASVRSQVSDGTSELAMLNERIQELRTEFAALDEEANLQSFGFYKPRYNFADVEGYERELERIRDEQKAMLKDKRAAICQIEWTVNGSKADGRKQINQTLKLMLRAFNGECDAAIVRVRYNNVHVMEARIEKAYEAINSLAGVQQSMITKQYRDLKLQELRLVHEYEEKVQEAKEEQRRIREQMREEEIAQRELEKATLDAEREEARYAQALVRAREEAERTVGAKHDKLLNDIGELQRRLAEAQSNKERAIARAQMTRSGHVYVISNVGSFGDDVYKIGMTRRLDPQERIRELGDASVPFQFDVHAVVFSEDAPALENMLHRAFHRQRVNRVNERKEFFRVTLDEIVSVVQEHDAQVAITRLAEAVEYRKTIAILDEERQRNAMIPIRAPLAQRQVVPSTSA